MSWWKFYLVLLALLALLFPAKPVYVAVYVLSAIYILSRRLLRLAVNRLEVVRTSEKTRLFPGETAKIGLVFQNRSAVPIAWVSGYEHLPAEVQAGKARRWILSLGPRAGRTVRYSVTGRRRGIYSIGPVDVTVGEHFGLYQDSRTVDLRHRLVVYPNVYHLNELGLPAHLPVGNLRPRQRIYPDPSRLAGVRPYMEGDPRKTIHWKATARTGKLQVKQFDHTVASETVIFLNLDERDYDVHTFSVDTELAIETAASLASYLTQVGEPFGFSTNVVAPTDLEAEALQSGQSTDRGFLIPPRKGRGHLAQVLEVLAALDCGAAFDFPTHVARQVSGFSWGATVLIVTPQDPEPLISTSLSLIRSGYQVQIFLTGQKVAHRELLDRPRHARLQLFKVTRAMLADAGVVQ